MKTHLALTTLLVQGVVGLDTTCTFHAQHYGTLSTDYESNLRHLGCADEMVGWGKASDVATTMAADFARKLGIHITSSSLGGRYSCGSCLKVCSTSGTCEFVTVVDLGGGQLDLHPDIFLKLFGISAPEAPKESYWADDEAAQRFKGMGGHPACQVTVVGTENCVGHWKNGGGGGYEENPPADEEPAPEPQPQPLPEPEPVPKKETPPAETTETAPTPTPTPEYTPPETSSTGPEYSSTEVPAVEMADIPLVSEGTAADPPALDTASEATYNVDAPVPDTTAPSYGTPMTDSTGSCHQTLTCSPTDPTKFFPCTSSQTWTMDVAPGTECVCKEGGWNDGDYCEGMIQWASGGPSEELGTVQRTEVNSSTGETQNVSYGGQGEMPTY